MKYRFFWDTVRMQGFVDAHFHLLELEKKGYDCVLLLEQADERGLGWLLDAGVDGEGMEKRLKLARQYRQLLLAVGFSPAFVCHKGWEHEVGTAISRWVLSEKVVAIGEIGLDYYWNYGTHGEQRGLLELELGLAKQFNLPVVIHNRDADQDLVSMLKHFGQIGGMLHCFTGDYRFAYKLVDLGFYISFAGNITYNSSVAIQESAQRIPFNRLLIETDAPYLAPQPVRGSVNTPFSIEHTYSFISRLVKKPIHELKERVELNFFDLFLRNKGGMSSPIPIQQ